MLSLSERVRKIAPSATLQMKAKAKVLKDQGIKVVSLSAGEPDFETPKPIVDAARVALDKGVSRYTGSRGTDELISAMQTKFERDQGVKYDATQVLSTLGAKSAISMALDALVGPGDEVILFAPYWVSYPEQVRLSGAEPVVVSSSKENGYLPTIADIKAAITDKTKVVILNTPNNPSGAVWNEALLKDFMKLLEDTDIWVISDEIYEHLLFDSQKHFSVAAFSQDAYNRSIVISGASKGYAMTGWRVGVVGGPKEAISAMVKLQEQRYTCIPAISQAAAAFALLETEPVKNEIETMRKAYEERRNELVKILEDMPNISCAVPKGAFYALLDLSSCIGKEVKGSVVKNDEELALRLLSEAHVATVAGTPFGVPGTVRISLASSMTDIEEGVRRIARWMAG